MYPFLNRRQNGFTLIELSIVLVIVGLVIVGVLVGKNLISNASLRATISQVERYNTAANAFRGKFGYLPSDIPQITATQFGFVGNATRQGGPGCGDGDDELDGTNYSSCVRTPSGGAYSGYQGGETVWFWEDLATNSHLIGGDFSATPNGTINCSPLAACSIYFPPAKQLLAQFTVRAFERNLFAEIFAAWAHNFGEKHGHS